MRAPLTPDRLLSGLTAIADTVSTRPHALALLALGSCGKERARLDGYSDLDFFVIVERQAKAAWIANLDWLTTGSPLVFAHKNTADGWKTLDQDGVFCEFAVFHQDELNQIPFAAGEVVWARADFDTSCLSPTRHSQVDDAQWLAVEAMTNILVGLKRLLRGEGLSASRAICVDAAHQVCALMQDNDKADPFNPWRRLETHHAQIAAKLAHALSGDEPAQSARRLMDILRDHVQVPEALDQEIRAHLDQYHAR
jgi:hypothetical protein